MLTSVFYLGPSLCDRLCLLPRLVGTTIEYQLSPQFHVGCYHLINGESCPLSILTRMPHCHLQQFFLVSQFSTHQFQLPLSCRLLTITVTPYFAQSLIFTFAFVKLIHYLKQIFILILIRSFYRGTAYNISCETNMTWLLPMQCIHCILNPVGID